MAISSVAASYLLGQTTQSNLLTIAARAQSGTGGGVTSGSSDAISVYKDAQANRDVRVATKAKEPALAREVEAFKKAVGKAKTTDDIFKNPLVLRVLLTANGLGEFSAAAGLAKKALLSDLEDANSTAARLQATKPAWYATAKSLELGKGLDTLKSSVNDIAEAYVEVRWQESLESSAQGVSYALAFKERVGNFTSAIKILADPVAREVVTQTLGIPKRIAFQSLSTQEQAITAKLDIEKLKSPEFVDKFIKRYLISLRGTSTTSTTA